MKEIDDSSILFTDDVPPKIDKETTNIIIADILTLAKSYKLRNAEEIQKSIIKIIDNSGISPSFIRNNNNENLIQLIVKEEKLESLELIVECYIKLLGFSDKFFDWFLSENKEGQTILETCVRINNKNIIKYIY